ncbi:uncharacterized protein CANTADRAFT_58176 [Suhomyces tanzawaensis NRRL Y-17324]|uniref:ferric-chelate reductase (NADPH) n=1 Tax=Suhomyces tanzawaensis NRRL Y-17324 TaxID=984487 RepID=A0A1E4SPE0_9ASCO|nr:uncharacterized protein CANTADRAFT_58176 [Suhomyces tanzawaensis NRRL Y-17324]ODV81356.1 hypothetical protein CANTADRAFT_58176 [Suhomyces tanzawaensis NRRL Y-17324]
MVRILVYLFLFVQLAVGALVVTHMADVGPQACATLLNRAVRFNEADGGLLYFCNVKNQPALGSMAHCIIDNFDSPIYLELFIKGCKGLNEDQVHGAYVNASGRMLNASTLTGMPLVFEPVQLAPAAVLMEFSSERNNALTNNWSVYYGVILTAYWFVILAIAAINHWTYYLFPNFIKSLHGPVFNWFRNHFVLAPTGRKAHSVPKKLVVEWLVPLRFETVTVLGWAVLAAIFASTNTLPNPGFALSTSVNRCAFLALWGMPVMILFAGRNNILQVMTGWPYARFLTIHRWMARLVVALLFIHGVGESVTAINLDYYLPTVQATDVIFGILAVTAGSLMLFQSLKYFRSKHYEIFLLVHIVLGVLFIVGGWKHTTAQGVPQFHYAAVVIWVFDRVVRLIRLVAFGVRMADIELINGETLKVTVSRPGWWKPYPGSHAFIHFVKPVHFWQSHPFSFVDSIVGEDTITFYMKVKEGITRSICDDLINAPNNKGKCKVVIEGPYGSPVPVHKFDNAVFLAGGNGMPGIFQDVLELSRKHIETKQVSKLFWVIRDIKSAQWFMDELVALENSAVDVVIYVTSMNSKDSINDGVGEKKNFREYGDMSERMSITQKLSHVEFRLGRPNIRELVLAEAAQTNKSIAFTTCSHPGMVDDVRAAVRECLSVDQSKRIELFEINQSW